MDIARYRLNGQRLVGEPFGEPADVVRWLGAVQAQDFLGAKWALALRARGTDNAALDRLYNEGAILRTHVMRPTWHFVAPEDIRWMLALTSPRIHAGMTFRHRQLELDEATLRRGDELITGALREHRYLTRPELSRVLQEGGLAEPTGGRLAHLVMHAELEGLICSGPLRGKQFTYALMDERVAPMPPRTREEALAELTLRYFTNHGPATPQDFAWWSGLTIADIKVGLELVGPDLQEIKVDRKSYWMAASAVPAAVESPTVHLLPNFDEFVVAYRDHGPSCHPDAHPVLQFDGRLGAHYVTRNGLIIGGWDRDIAKKQAVVRANLLVPLEEAERAALERAADSYSSFMALPVMLNTDLQST